MSEENHYDLKNIITDNKLVGLWRMLAGYKLLYVTAIIFVGLAAVARTGFYFLLAYFTDEVLGAENMLFLLPLVALGFVILAAIQGYFSFVSGRNAAKAAESVARRLRNYLYDHMQRLTYAYHDQMKTGELVQRSTSDVDAIRRFYSEQAIGIGRISLLFLVNFIGILILNVRLGLISVAIIPIIILISVYFFKRVSEAYEAFQEQDGILSTTLQENLSGVRVVKAFARQEYERNKFEGDNIEKYRRGRRLVMMHSLFWPVSDILCGLQMLLGFTVGALMAIAGTITIGEYLAYAGLIIWIIWPIRNLGRLVVQMSTGLVSFERVLTVLREEREPLHDGDYRPEGDVRGEIVFDNVCFAYGDAPVLHDISFQCAAGQTVALLGSTGSGKTSLVNLLPRFYDYTSGSIKLDGVELKRYPRGYLRYQIGIVAQEPFLFSRTIGENIAYGVSRPVTDEDIEAAARAAAIHDVILTFPDGYQTLVGERGVTLSGGQKQRVTIARTFLKDAPILILDDAVSAVDTETEAAIQKAIHRDGSSRTTFIIAHRIQSVMNADLILVLDQGRIVQKGTHDDLLIQPGPYRRIYDLQARIEDELLDDLARANGAKRNGSTNGRGRPVFDVESSAPQNKDR